MSRAKTDAARWRVVARLIDKIRKGPNPAEVPVELNEELDITVNLSAAQKLGRTFQTVSRAKRAR